MIDFYSFDWQATNGRLEKETEQTDRDTHTQTERQTDRQRERQREIDRAEVLKPKANSCEKFSEQNIFAQCTSALDETILCIIDSSRKQKNI